MKSLTCSTNSIVGQIIAKIKSKPYYIKQKLRILKVNQW